jgi:hypothetical protein
MPHVLHVAQDFGKAASFLEQINWAGFKPVQITYSIHQTSYLLQQLDPESDLDSAYH